MGYFQKLSESAGLVTGMAERLGVNLTRRFDTAPEIATRGFADMVMRCAQCPDHSGCARLQEDNPALDAPPSYCRNADVLRRPG